MIGNERQQLNTPEDLGRYDNSIQANDMAFDRSKSKKKHARNVIKYGKFLGMKESLQTLILQAVDEPFVEALKEEYIGHGGRTPYKMIVHLRIKISKVTNRDKLQLKLLHGNSPGPVSEFQSN